MPLSPPIAQLLEQFHARKPARIWSLIVTLYGDAIVPRGGSLWIGSLIEIMALFGIDAGHVRTAVSRLSSDGWLSSTKRGRASYYRLSHVGEDEFLQATQRIYSSIPIRRGALRVALIGPAVADAAALRTGLKAAGFAPLSPVIHVGLGHPPPELQTAGLYVLTPDEADKRDLAASAWRLDEMAQAYRDFIAQFSPLAALLDSHALKDDEALLARTLLIHAFRRLVLRDPALPADLLPQDWGGDAARALAGRVYGSVVAPSERFLDVHGQNEVGPLPPADASFHKRFSS
jgi:phenylacetic acid degradation operon negative regulatory protein